MTEMKKPEPSPEHQWLQRLIGDWTYEGEANMGPDAPAAQFRGSERVRSLGDIWIVSEGEGGMPGGDTSPSLMTLGYDPKKQRFVGTFLSAMMAWMWVYDGTLEGDRLVLDTEGPSMSDDGTTARYRDIIELRSDTERTMTSESLTPDGSWTRIMTMTLRRK